MYGHHMGLYNIRGEIVPYVNYKIVSNCHRGHMYKSIFKENDHNKFGGLICSTFFDVLLLLINCEKFKHALIKCKEPNFTQLQIHKPLSEFLSFKNN